VSTLWVGLVVAALGCYLIKLAGLSLPGRVLQHPRVQRVAAFLPVAMLAALVAVQLVDGGQRYALDWRVLAGMAAAVVALLLRRGFLVVFLTAVVVTAVLRLLT